MVAHIRQEYHGRYVGRTSRNLFVIDCESEEAFAEHLLAASKRNLNPWVVRTARGGHLYFFCADGEVQDIRPGTLPHVEVRGSSGYVLCPPSLHPSGATYTWLIQEGDEPPTVAKEQIDWLRNAEGKPISLKVKPTRQRQPARPAKLQSRALPEHLKDDPRTKKLSKATLDYIEMGQRTPEGKRNNALFAAACDLAGCGFDRAEATRLLEPIAAKSGLPLREIDKTLASAYSEDRTPSRPSSTPGFAADSMPWRFAEAYANGVRWTGQAGQTDMKVLLALAQRAKDGMNERGVFRASQREIQELARVGSRNTVRKSLERLLRHGFIFKLDKTDRVSDATLWRFSNKLLERGKSLLKSDPLISLPMGEETSGSLLHTASQPGTDAWERGALGPTGMRVYYALLPLSGPPTLGDHVGRARHLANITRLNVSQVYSGLRKLREYGLVENIARGWWKVTKIVTHAEFDELVAKPAGTLGKGEKRAQKIADERAAYVGWKLELWRRKRDPDYPHYQEPLPVPLRPKSRLSMDDWNAMIEAEFEEEMSINPGMESDPLDGDEVDWIIEEGFAASEAALEEVWDEALIEEEHVEWAENGSLENGSPVVVSTSIRSP